MGRSVVSRGTVYTHGHGGLVLGREVVRCAVGCVDGVSGTRSS